MEISTDRTYPMTCSPESFWDAVARTDSFQTWWPWLKTLRADDLAQGRTWDCVVQPPLPYEVRFRLAFDRVEEHSVIAARVAGDVAGWAWLDIARSGAGCTVRLRSRLAPQSRLLRLTGVLARPIAVFGHDWVLDRGARQFQQRALGPTAVYRPDGG